MNFLKYSFRVAFQGGKLSNILVFPFLCCFFCCCCESFSGITKKILKPVTTKLKDVQRQLKILLPPDAVLVGHSLDLDLRALKVSI